MKPLLSLPKLRDPFSGILSLTPVRKGTHVIFLSGIWSWSCLIGHWTSHLLFYVFSHINNFISKFYNHGKKGTRMRLLRTLFHICRIFSNVATFLDLAIFLPLKRLNFLVERSQDYPPQAITSMTQRSAHWRCTLSGRQWNHKDLGAEEGNHHQDYYQQGFAKENKKMENGDSGYVLPRQDAKTRMSNSTTSRFAPGFFFLLIFAPPASRGRFLSAIPHPLLSEDNLSLILFLISPCGNRYLSVLFHNFITYLSCESW